MNAEEQKAAKAKLWKHLKHFRLALPALVEVMEFGASKPGREPGGFVDGFFAAEEEDYFTNAAMRHALAAEYSPWDYESGLLHKAHVAANAMMDLECALIQQQWDDVEWEGTETPTGEPCHDIMELAAALDAEAVRFDDIYGDAPLESFLGEAFDEALPEIEMSLEEFLNLLDVEADSNEDPTVPKNTTPDLNPWAAFRVLPRQRDK